MKEGAAEHPGVEAAAVTAVGGEAAHMGTATCAESRPPV